MTWTAFKTLFQNVLGIHVKNSVQPVMLINNAGETYEAGSGGGGGGTIDITTLAKEGKQDAGNTILNSILAELRDDVFVQSTIWEDRSNTTSVFYREERIRSQDDGTITTVYTRLSDNVVVGSLPAGCIPAQGATDRLIQYYRYIAVNAGTGYAVGNFVVNTLVFDTGGTGAVIGNIWYNLTTSAAIATAPAGADLIDPEDWLRSAFGSQTDSAATSDTGTFSFMSFVKRALQNWTALLSNFGTDGATPPAITGTGIRGWLRGIYEKVAGTLAISGRVTTFGTEFTFSASNVNSTTTQLAASAIFTGQVESIINQQSYSILFFADQNANITINQFIDSGGTKNIQQLTFAYTAGSRLARSGVANGNFFQVIVQNTGASPTTTLQLDTAYGTIPSATQLNNAPIALNEVNGTALSLGQKTMANSIPITIASDQTGTPISVSPPAKTSVGGWANVGGTFHQNMLGTDGETATDVRNFQSGILYVSATGAFGAYVVETAYNSGFTIGVKLLPLVEMELPNQNPIVATISVTAATRAFYLNLQGVNFLRVRMTTASAGAGNPVMYAVLNQATHIPNFLNIQQAAAANLAVTASIAASQTLATVTTVTKAQLDGQSITDQASAAITTTTNSAAIAMTNVQSCSFNVAVTAVSGTTPTLDITIEETFDGTTWLPLYQFERITATGNFVTPLLRINGQSIRYAQTVSGTTPSFTRTYVRTQKSIRGLSIKRFFDRTIVPNTLNSTTPTYNVESYPFITAVLNSGAATTGCFAQLQISPDGSTWQNLANPVQTVASAITTIFSGAINAKFARVIITTAGTGQTLSYVQIQCSDAGGDTSAAKERKQDLAVWEAIAGNNKVFTYYTGVAGGNPSGSTSNIQTIQYRTGSTVIITQTLTYDANNNILSITAA